MKVDVKHAKFDGVSDGSSITIESSDGSMIDAKHVGITTNNVDEFADSDELWIFKRTKFLKAVAKALNVVIYEPGNDTTFLDDPGYYK